METKTLRSYQDEHFPQIYQALVDRKDVLLSYCVSGGKTCMAMAAASAALAHYTHIIILTPSITIENQFRQFSLSTDSVITSSQVIPVASIDQDRSAKAMRRYCQSDNSERNIFIANYRVFDWKQLHKIIGDNIRNYLLVIDEAHHTAIDPQNQVSCRTNEFRLAGGITFKLTGTPYRTDQAEITDESVIQVRRSLLQHMLEGFAPSQIYSEIVTIDGGGTSDEDEDPNQGTWGIPRNEELGFQKIVEHVIKDGRPKCIIRLKPGSQEQNPKRVEALTKLLEAQGLSVVNATGEGTEAFQALCELENAPKTFSYDDTADVVIAFGRMNEGVNIPSRSHIYFYGVPRSMQLIEQVLGRVMRKRLCGNGQLIRNYPKQWRDASKVTLFLGSVENVSDKHTNFLLQLISYLSAFQAIEMFSHVTRINDGIANPKRRSIQSILDLLDELKSEKSGYGLTCLKQAVSLFEEYRTPWTQDMTKSALVRMAFFLAEKQKLKVTMTDLSRILILNQGVSDPRIQEAIKTATIDMNDSYPEELGQALDSIYDEFQNECLVSDNIYLIEGENAAWIAERLKDELSTGPAPISFNEIWEGVVAFREANRGLFPKLLDRDPLRNRSFRSYHNSMKKGAFDGIEMDFYDFVIQRDSENKSWHKRLAEVVEEIRQAMEYRTAEEAMNSNKTTTILKKYSLQMAEMFYYPKALEALRNFDWASKLTLPDAHYLGQRGKSTIEQLIEREGLVMVKNMIQARNLP